MSDDGAWAQGYQKGEADGRQHARAAIARAMRTRADDMEAEAQRMLPLLTSNRQRTHDKLVARADLLREVADKIENGVYEGADKEMNA